MHRLLYFAPLDAPRVTPGDLVRYDLDWSLGGAPLAVRRILGAGPSGHPGVLFAADAKDAPALAYKAERQTWEPAGAGLWIGYETDGRPGPEDLARPEPFSGAPLTLLDGAAWTVPHVRLKGYASALPRAVALDPEGVLQSRPLARYARLEALSDRVWSWYMDGGEIEHRTLYEAAALGLGLNYRIGIPEANALWLFATDTLRAACRILVDFDAWSALMDELQTAAEKKSLASTPGGSGTSCGAKGGSTGTNPPTSTSPPCPPSDEDS